MNYKRPSLGESSVDPYGLWVFFLWRFYEGYVYVPFIFILMVLIAVYWTLLLCTETTCFPTQPRLRCATWPCCPQIRTCCCLTTTAGNVLPQRAYLVEARAELWQSTSTQSDRILWGAAHGSRKASHVPLYTGFKFGADSKLDHGHVSRRKHCRREQEVQEWPTTISLKIRISLDLFVIYLFFLG